MNLEYLRATTILFVDDEEIITKQAYLGLEDVVKKIFIANNGIEALDIIKNNDIDVLVTDIRMPNMTGIELLEAIKATSLSIKGSIITSAFDDTQYFHKAIELKVSKYMIKPINFKELIEEISLIMTPYMDQKILQKHQDILGVLTLIGGKKIRIVEHIINNLNSDQLFLGTHQDIIDTLGISKVTVVNTFKELAKAGVLVKVRNGTYQYALATQGQS